MWVQRAPRACALAAQPRGATSTSFPTLLRLVEEADSLVVLTGAGMSTESGIPDYRGERGAYKTGFKPIMHRDFVQSLASRRRYWARSFAGWGTFRMAGPNSGHVAMARLQSQRQWSLVTQNVDRLHQIAGSGDVLELHGTTHEVICLGCSFRMPRPAFQQWLLDLNPAHAALATLPTAKGEKVANVRALEEELKDAGMQRPDGDMELAADADAHFVVPDCPKCGGTLKPDVVFFGDNVPPWRHAEAERRIHGADALLIVGSSVTVFSAFRLARLAREKGLPIAVINQGDTRVDPFEGLVKYDQEPIGATMQRLQRHLIP